MTIEGLELGGGKLNPVQQAIVEQGGSQCGFCTPGIVLSLTSLLLQEGVPGDTEKEVAKGLSGHLCRCTGYRSLKEAGAQALESVEAAGRRRAGRGRPPAFLFRRHPRAARRLGTGGSNGVQPERW